MLRGIQKASSNWVGKTVLTLVMGLIAVSFAVWGIGDIFRGFGRSTVAKIGGQEITIEQFRVIYNERLQQISRQLGRPITPELARQLGLPTQIIGQMLAEAAIDARARSLGLNLSNAEIARQITSDPLFQGPAGGFDRLRFEQMIRNAGYTEARYTQEQRRVALRRHIADAVAGGIVAPQTAADAAHQFANEQRSAEYITLGPAQAGDIPAPAPDVLAKYFEDNKALFRAPEYRSVTILSLTPKDIAPWLEVSDDDVRRAYEAHRSRFATPERRTLQQIVFPSADEAKAAIDRLAEGMTFAQLAAERKLSDADINLGTLDKSGIIDRKIAEAAFSLKEGETSGPVAGTFGTVLINVVKIEPEQAQPYERAAATLKQELAVARARNEVQSRHDKVEDDRAAGLRLDEIAKKLGVQAQVIEAVDRSGRTPAGDLVPNLPTDVDVIKAAFSADVGVETDPLQAPDNGYVWFEVTSVQPSRERTFEEVKERIEARWRNDQIATQLKEKAEAFVEKAKSGESLADHAGAAGVEVKTATALRRDARTAPAKFVDAVFSQSIGDIASVEGNEPSERIIFRVTDVKAPTLEAGSADARKLTEQVQRSLSQDIVTQYITRLEKDMGSTINQEALNQVVGGTEQN